MKRVALIVGARPNYMKVFPIWKVLRRDYGSWLHPEIIHTGQHHDFQMSDIFFRDLGLPEPDHFLGVGSGSHGDQTGRTMIAIERLFLTSTPALVVVVGDVNSTVAGALVAAKLNIPVAHVEAGLRSRDRAMPEEINRIVTDCVADLLFTSSRDASANLREEGVREDRIYCVGNVMIDSLVQFVPTLQRSTVLEKLGLPPGGYVCATFHRPSNVDDDAQLLRLMTSLSRLGELLPVVLPLHPRTSQALRSVQKRLGEPVIDPTRIREVEPLGYVDFLALMSQAAAVVTDSGGIQEETTYLGIPCFTVRPNTERPITIWEGTNRLVDLDADDLHALVKAGLSTTRRRLRPIELWDGNAAERICRAIAHFLRAEQM